MASGVELVCTGSDGDEWERKERGGSEKGRVKEKDEKGWVLVVPKGRTSRPSTKREQ